MIEIRPLHEDEIGSASLLVPKGSPDPDWKNCWAVFWKGKLEHIFSMENRLVVEPMYGSGHAMSAFAAMTWIDGFMRTQGKAGYEFFVGDENPQFQNFINEHLPVKSGREKTGKYYFRKFEV